MKRCWFCFKNMNRIFVSEHFLHCTNTILFAFTLHRKAEQWLTGRQKIPGIFYIIPMYVAMKGWAFWVSTHSNEFCAFASAVNDNKHIPASIGYIFL